MIVYMYVLLDRWAVSQCHSVQIYATRQVDSTTVWQLYKVCAIQQVDSITV